MDTIVACIMRSPAKVSFFQSFPHMPGGPGAPPDAAARGPSRAPTAASDCIGPLRSAEAAIGPVGRKIAARA